MQFWRIALTKNAACGADSAGQHALHNCVSHCGPPGVWAAAFHCFAGTPPRPPASPHFSACAHSPTS
eukprot:5518729-Pyramimonas_sp.AAC.1